MFKTPDISVKRSTYRDADFQALVNELDKELSGRYGEEQAFYDRYNKLSDDTRVVLIYYTEEAIGCGSFRPVSEPFTFEIKRMFVKPGYRGRGIARKILSALEAWALEEKFTTALLETGLKQPEAIAAYLKAGYCIIDNYGPYVNSSYSVCMQKILNSNRTV